MMGSGDPEAENMFGTAKLLDVIYYLRHGSHLKLPNHWEEYFSYHGLGVKGLYR